MTIAELADEYGTLSAQIKALETKREAVKKKLLTYKSDTLVGDRYTVSKTVYTASRLDTAAVKHYLGDALVEKYSTTSISVRLSISLSAAKVEEAA